jgi:nucleoid-associated protein YgaU
MQRPRPGFVFALLVSLPGLAVSGCGYVHFGRLTEVTPMGDNALVQALADLRTEHKIVQQELVLARREGDALRAAIENRAAGGTAPAIAERLGETTRELAALRASYASLSAERSPSPATAASAAARESELSKELARARTELEQIRSENLALTTRVKEVTAQNEQIQTALSQLNTELLAEKESRARADQNAEVSRAQLQAVVAQHAGAPATLGEARGGTATAALATNSARVISSAAAAPVVGPARTHVVAAGETIEALAEKYYGSADQWPAIYVANRAVLDDSHAPKPGTELTIPEE